MKHIFLIILALTNLESIASEPTTKTQTEIPILIDVRTNAEWSEGHIETAVHIPLDTILDNIELAASNKEQTIYLYCGSGRRSGKAEKALQSMGYINAKNIGGIKEASSALKLQIISD